MVSAYSDAFRQLKPLRLAWKLLAEMFWETPIHQIKDKKINHMIYQNKVFIVLSFNSSPAISPFQLHIEVGK